MLTTNDFCRMEYGQKLYKISFEAGFSCPNRDGTLGESGCIFCSGQGSGDFAVKITSDIDNEELERQISRAKEKVAGKFKGSQYIAYFQAFTNTYAPLPVLKELFYKLILREDIAVLSIATRPDCLPDDVMNLLEELNRIKPVWVELGLQTVKGESIELIRRGYATGVYDEAVQKLRQIGIHVITHVILFLPDESEEDMLNTVSHVVEVQSDGIKLQMLQVLLGTDLYRLYRERGFYIPSMEEYAAMVKKCIELVPENVVVHRLTGDPPRSLLVEPKWTLDKKRVLNCLKSCTNSNC